MSIGATLLKVLVKLGTKTKPKPKRLTFEENQEAVLEGMNQLIKDQKAAIKGLNKGGIMDGSVQKALKELRESAPKRDKD